MLKKLIAPILAGAMLAFALPAAAATVEVNLYGASAQYLFWNDAADDFLTAQGCSNVEQAEDASGKQGITRGTSCTGLSNNDIIIRYASKASYDGIRAMKGVDPDNQCPGQPTHRAMADENDTNWTTGVVNSTKCVDVTLGNSDVSGEAFVQSSHGAKEGPNGGAWIDRSFNEIDASGLDYYNPLVVPFGFFLNNSVEIKRCTYPDPTEPTSAAHKAMSMWGNVCYDGDADGHSADCVGYYKCVGGLCSGGENAGNECATANECPDVLESATVCEDMPLDNISRIMAVQIFSGQAYYWSDFGAFFPATDIVACFRHAGSGTHATLDWSVMRGKDWGWSMANTESTTAPVAYFNDGSTYMMNCINDMTGAIGYADADQLAGTKNFPNVHASKYNGVYPKRQMIRNGWYDFWSAQWTYEDPAEPNYANTHPVVTALIAFASNPNNIPSTKAAYWSTRDEMNWMKSSDKAYPAYQGATNPQTP